MQSVPSIVHVTCFGGTLSMTWYSRQRFKIKVQSCPVLPPPAPAPPVLPESEEDGAPPTLGGRLPSEPPPPPSGDMWLYQVVNVPREIARATTCNAKKRSRLMTNLKVRSEVPFAKGCKQHGRCTHRTSLLTPLT